MTDNQDDFPPNSPEDDQPPLFKDFAGSGPRPKPRWYSLKNGKRISSHRLSELERDDQLDAMRQWFYENYEDPVHSCPHDSEEGGYQFVYGGPYEAGEELNGEFGGLVDDDVIEELTDELENECAYWSGNSNKFTPDIDDYVFRSSAESFRQEEAFWQSARNVERLLKLKVESEDQQCFFRLLYGNVITALETYLADKFISSVNADDKLLRKFVESSPEFKKRRLRLSEVFNAREGIEDEVKKHLSDVVWHRLAVVKSMFQDTLGVAFPPDLQYLHEAVIVRHDCVHRNGKKKKDESEHVLTGNDITTLLAKVGKLVKWIEAGGRDPEEFDSSF